MDGKLARLAGGGSALSVVFLALADSDARGRLSDTAWNEAVSLCTNVGSDPHSGEDSAVPEPLNGALAGSNSSLTGSVIFAAPGPPNTTATVEAMYQSGSPPTPTRRSTCRRCWGRS